MVRFTSPSRSKLRRVRVSIFWEIPLISRLSSPCRFTPNARAYRTSAVHFSESRSSTCREPYCESNTVGCEYSFVSTSFTSFISLRHLKVPTYQAREYHVIVSLAERDVNTCLVMWQRPQGSDTRHVSMPGRLSDESYVPLCKGSDQKKLPSASPGGRMRAGPSRTHASGRKRTWHRENILWSPSVSGTTVKDLQQPLSRMKSPLCNIQASATCPGLTFFAVASSKTTFAAFTLASKFSPW